MENVDRTIEGKVVATYENGRDVFLSDRDNSLMTAPLPVGKRRPELAKQSRKQTGFSRRERYRYASDLHVQEAEGRAKRKLVNELAAVVPNAGVGGAAAALAPHTGGASSKLGALKLSGAAKHGGKAANNFARAAVIESERIRRGLPEPNISYWPEVKRGATRGFIGAVQSASLSHAGTTLLADAEHVTHFDALRDRVFSSPTFPGRVGAPGMSWLSKLTL